VSRRKPLSHYLKLQYPFQLIADPEGGWVVAFPDLPGCMTQVDTLDEIPHMVSEVFELWMEVTYESGIEIPLPSYPEEHSGKFNLRLPKSLHRELAEAAERDGVSLNQHVVALLARRDFEAAVEQRLAEIERTLAERSEYATHVADDRATYKRARAARPKRTSAPRSGAKTSALKKASPRA
jgi:predicted RNase H-like HicB family nuclease